MNKLRLADVRTPIARAMNICATSDEVVSLANEAHRRLVGKGKWLGTVTRYRICTSSEGCLCWPRQVETIEAWMLCSTPGVVRNGWYETAQNGPGLLTSDDCFSTTMLDRGTRVTFDDIYGIDKKIKVVADVTEASGLRILIKGYDQNANWIRTQDAGEWIDGEYVTISTTAQYTTNLFTNITDIIKPATNGPVRIFEYDTTLATTTKALGYYENDELVPIYRASMIPGLGNVTSGSVDSDGEACNTKQITVVAKLRHIDVVNDNDFFLLGNLAAIKLMAMAILKENRNLFEESMAYEAKAIKELQDELSSFEGDGALPILRQESSATWGAGVLNYVTLGYRSIY
jgi:hypothetical protein